MDLVHQVVYHGVRLRKQNRSLAPVLIFYLYPGKFRRVPGSLAHSGIKVCRDGNYGIRYLAPVNFRCLL